MKLIVGLGNPGKEYQNNRHNFGFMVLDSWALDLKWKKSVRFKSEIADLPPVQYERAILVKPRTFMNLSGEAVLAASRFYKVGFSDILVIHDDVDLPLGNIRFARKGSAGGHNGVSSVVQLLGSQNFCRLKLGVGRSHNPHVDTADHVLEDFLKGESRTRDHVIRTAVQAVQVWLAEGIDQAMNRFNPNRAVAAGGKREILP